jgi:hypothetical protein
MAQSVRSDIVGPRSASSPIQGHCKCKRKGSPVIENGQPTKFISLDKAVFWFQRNIPYRFHPRPRMDKLRSSPQHRKGITVKGSTIPLSQNLRSHLRSCPVHYPTREEEEKKVEEMKVMRVKVNASNPKIFEPPTLSIRVERKPPMVPVPFKLTEISIKKSTAPPVFIFTAKPVPKAVLDAPQGIPKKKGIHGFGIPPTGSTDWKRTIEVQPFSFDARDQLLLKKKGENIKKRG